MKTARHRRTLLPELGLALLDGGHDHVTDTTSRQSVQAGTDTLDGDDVQVAGTGVVCAVHDSTAVLPLADELSRRHGTSMIAEASSNLIGGRTQADRGSS